MAAISLEVYGIVQGVGFRYMTKILADQIGVTGKVLNKNDGSVYIEAQGDPEKLSAFIEGVKASPTPAGRVDRVVLKSIPENSYTRFSVAYM
ncbi:MULTISPECIES: acylphosphatase [Ligilactobacillus]|jgi:acylphosphatase|uniref:acylphosphatase n=1 Tax=Ligilactobacillus animalis TaxID=1605 RepID=A0AAJ6K4A9_9LACO|nr:MULTISPECIES: acylphosphatase [Ligilactobacillus]KDA45450.1 carbamoyltransferase HypF, hypF [Ligilactobacillus animalis]KRM57770.1 acylphosphatase [Ligilactobacillus animalis KCTC 3501 = DSM 20602]MBU5279253.1 acylphosphatase [Ligilactobacillus animalis]MDO5883191.1 acylphosphatase [Ligilactobacillus animalis]MDQ2233882.1 acylphosphatase [Ligilactobacillus animalis]